MNIPDTLHFIRPWWFAMLVPLGILLWLLARGRLASKSWEAVCDRHLLPFMLLGRAVGVSRRGFLYLTTLSAVLLITALAGPAWERLPQPVLRDDSVLVVVLDLSLSMDAVDIKPSRLSRARFKLSDLLTRRQHGQVGLVVYARDAFTVVPPTDDTSAIELYLQSLATHLMPRQGSRGDLGLQEADTLLQRSDAAVGEVLLVTDYADGRMISQAQLLNAKGYKVSVLGVGTESGGPVSLSSGEFLSHRGEIVIPRLEENQLNNLAQAGGGIYVRFNPLANSDVEVLTQRLDAHVSTAGKEERSEATSEVWREQGPWLIVLALPIVALGFRRGLLVLIASAVLLPLQPAYALSWADLWRRPDQQAVRALEKGDTEQAVRLFENQEWKAAAQYRNRNFTAAVETLEQLDGAANWYNKGNALVGAGKLKAAVEAYRQALKIKPDMQDAQYNLGIVEQQLQAMQEQTMRGQQSEDGSTDQQAQATSASGHQDAPADQNAEASAAGEKSAEALSEKDEQAAADEKAGKEGQEQGGDGDSTDARSTPQTMAEKDQSIEQWLRGVPDDPARLLKRKLHHLSRNQQRDGREEQPW